MKSGMTRMVALAGGLLMIAVPTVASADPGGDEMTTIQARKVYLKAVCPLNTAIESLNEAESAPDASWATVRPLVLRVANLQMRTANRLASPKRAWPANVRTQVASVRAFDRMSAGTNYAAANAASLSEYRALMDAFASDLPPTLDREITQFFAARRAIYRRLDLPEKNACKGV